MENLRAQALMTGMLAAIIFSGLLTAIVIDRPFIGAVKVHPDPLAEVMRDFGSSALSPQPPRPPDLSTIPN